MMVSSGNQGPIQRTAAGLLANIVAPEVAAGLSHIGEFADLTLDSRKVADRSLFLAMPGEQTDGRCFATRAIAGGAAAVVFESTDAPADCELLAGQGEAAGVRGLRTYASEIASRFYGHPSRSMTVIGVTGTNGKTTCAWLLANAIERAGQRAGILGTLGSGPVGSLNQSSLTTADAVSVQRELRSLLDQDCATVCMEVSSHGLDQHRVDAVDFDIALFTNLSQDHLDYHGDMAQYAAAKKRLFAMPGLDGMVINVDDELGRTLLGEARSSGSDLKVCSYGLSQGDLQAGNVHFAPSGISFQLCEGARQARVASPLIGAINLPNLLGVAGCLRLMDFSLEDTAALLSELSAPPGRMETLGGAADQLTVVVDYAHTPDSLERVLESLRLHTPGQLRVVFGCGGDRDRGKRAQMGEIASRLADYAIVTNDNPRTESPDAIADGIEAGMPAGTNWRRVLDRREAIRIAIEDANSNDLVLVAGKGHESTQTIGDVALPFSDRAVVRELLGLPS